MFLPRFWLLGYGLGEILALLSYILLHLQVRRLFRPSYLEVFPWLISFLPPLFNTVFILPRGLLLWIPLSGVLADVRIKKKNSGIPDSNENEAINLWMDLLSA